MRKPQEIEDEEHEQVLQRVAAIDVVKKAGMVCTRVPHDTRPGRRRTRVREVAATTAAILGLGAYTIGKGHCAAGEGCGARMRSAGCVMVAALDAACGDPLAASGLSAPRHEAEALGTGP